jgi:hypothetical protein
MTVSGEVDLGAQAASGAPERVVVGFGPAWSPFFSGTGGVLVSPADGGVHRHGPADVGISVGCRQNRGEDSFPDAVRGPPDQAFVSGLERAELVRQVPPGRAGAVLPRDGFQGSAVIGPSPTADRISRHQRLDSVPHRISDH